MIWAFTVVLDHWREKLSHVRGLKQLEGDAYRTYTNKYLAGLPHSFISNFIPDKFSFKVENRDSQTEKRGVLESQPLTNTPAPGLCICITYTYKYIHNWELKENFALKIVSVGSFTVCTVVRGDWLDETSPQNSDSWKKTSFWEHLLSFQYTLRPRSSGTVT